MIEALTTVAQFLLTHGELLDDIYQAIKSGKVSNEDLRKAVRDAMVAASDAAMQAELGDK